MYALAMAEGIPADGYVVSLEVEEIAQVAQKVFDASLVRSKIKLFVGSASEVMEQMQSSVEKFDIIFIDADKEDYIKYYM